MQGTVSIELPQPAASMADLYRDLRAALAAQPPGTAGGWPNPPREYYIWSNGADPGLPLIETARLVIALLEDDPRASAIDGIYLRTLPSQIWCRILVVGSLGVAPPIATIAIEGREKADPGAWTPPAPATARNADSRPAREKAENGK